MVNRLGHRPRLKSEEIRKKEWHMLAYVIFLL